MKNWLIQTFNISESDAEVFSASFEKVTLVKGEKFIPYGKVNNKIGFVEKGLLKCTLIGANKTLVDDFVFENQFVANYYSFLKEEVSNKDITCLKDSVLRVITRKQLNELANKHPFVEKMARQIAEELFTSTAEKLEDVKLLSAEERYIKLLKIYKRNIDEIPQYEIASYLNISPETVSRIRRKISLRS